MTRARLQLLAVLGVLVALAASQLVNRHRSEGGTQPAPQGPINGGVSSAPTPKTSAHEFNLQEISDPDERAAVAKTLTLIEAGGPFLHGQDGSVFSNRERLLPEKPRGFYREYTVETAGAETRGARRIVQGSDGETYYTNDHYRSFRRLR